MFSVDIMECPETGLALCKDLLKYLAEKRHA